MLENIDSFLQEKCQKFVDFIYFNFGINNFQIAVVLLLLAMIFRIYGGYFLYTEDKTKIFISAGMVGIGIILFCVDYYVTKRSEKSVLNGSKNPIPSTKGILFLKTITGILILFIIFISFILNKNPSFFSIGFYLDFFYYYFLCCELPRKRKGKKRKLVYS